MLKRLLLITVLALGLAPATTQAAEIWCAPPAAGYVCTGTSGNDLIHGTGGNDTIRGQAGKDEIHGLAGADVLRGSNGDDDLFGGGAGSSTGDGNELYGGDGDDLLDHWLDNSGCPWGLMDGGPGSDLGRGYQGSGHQTFMVDVESVNWATCP